VSIYENVGEKSVKELIEDLHTNATVLPEFQRDFVWEPSATINLLVSVASDYPAGNILRVRDGNQIATRSVDSAPPIRDGHRPTFLILDGQQRLTSLYHALYGRGSHRYYLNLKNAEQDVEFSKEDTLSFLDADDSPPEIEVNIQMQADGRLLPLSVFCGREGGFWKWKDDISELLPESERRDFDGLCRRLWDSRLKNWEQYRFPVVTLKETTSLEALCTIFETLNMSGVKLGVFELMTAKAWKFGLNLREMWDNAREQYPEFSTYDVLPYQILQSIALVAKETCARKAILSLTKDDLEQYWDPIVKHTNEGLTHLNSRCGVMSRRWLPTPSIMGPLAAILYHARSARGPERGRRQQQITRWLWCSIFSRRYEAAANTRAEKDVKEAKEWFLNNTIPEVIQLFHFDPVLLRQTHKPASPIYKGVICLILSTTPKALDFHTAGEITEVLVRSGKVEDHHLFPKSFLKNQLGITVRELVNCVLNRTLIHDETNRSIAGRAPSEYLNDICQEFDVDSVLKSHLIATGPDSPLRRDEFQDFLEDREARILAEIARVTS
jgi:hypothetical protein